MERSDSLTLPVLLILVTTTLLFCRLGVLSFSVDEFVNVRIDRQPLIDILDALAEGTDLHPPLTHWLSHLWTRLLGESEWALRSIWAFSSVVTVALTYRLGAALGSWRGGLLGALLLATSSTFLLYARFVKYYALTMLLAVALTLTFYRLRKSPARGHWLLYLFLLVAFLYTDYFGPALALLWQEGFALVEFMRRQTLREKNFLKRLLTAQVWAVLLWSPWLTVAWKQASRVAALQEADIGQGFFAFALKVIYAHYSFALGESIFPWNPFALVGMAGFLSAWVAGLSALWRGNRLARWTGSFALLSIGLVAGVTSSVITGVPFIAFANHILFSMPLFWLWLAAGVLTIRLRTIRWLTVGLLMVGHWAGVANYFAGREFHNPIYVVPTREIVAQIAREVGSGDVVLAAGDIGIDFYASRTPAWNAPILDTSDVRAMERLREPPLPPRIWLFIFGRDRTREVNPVALQEAIAAHCRLLEVRGYGEQNPLYRALKERLFRRPAYRYKLSLYVYGCD